MYCTVRKMTAKTYGQHSKKYKSQEKGKEKTELPMSCSLLFILVKVPCECITENIARGCGREPIKREAQPSALFA